MSAHTPGPWKYLQFKSSIGNFEIKAGKLFIAETTGGLGSEEEANAKLIAAATDLLTYLEAASNYIDKLGGNSNRYRKLIAKAIGVNS